MRAVALDYNLRSVAEREVADPSITAADQVLMRIREVGVCGTDRELAAFRLGTPPPGESCLVLGHEALGEVLAAGSESPFRPGDLVVPMVRRACSSHCRMCRAGRRDLCLTGTYTERGIFGAHGYFAELAVDSSSDLVRVPHRLAEHAVLVEPLSVIEKAVALAFRLHTGGAERAVVIGAGTIGLLAALTLRLRGLDVSVVSLESPNSDRARLVVSAGIPYTPAAPSTADIVIEAAGGAGAALSGLNALGPLGVLVVLGAVVAENFPLLNLIVGNQVVAGSVNASPEAFRQAVEDLEKMPAAVLQGMVNRMEFDAFRESLTGPPGSKPKTVHVLA